MTGQPYDPYRHADELGLRVETRHIDHDGLWLPDRHLILLRPGLLAVQERCVLAHEIGHAVHGHRDSRPRHERAADRWAAERLIDPARLEEAMRASPDPGRWSLDVGVTTKMLEIWLARHRLDLAA